MEAIQVRESSDPHPGFKVLSLRVEKFYGRTGESDFDVWSLDFVEATVDCG